MLCKSFVSDSLLGRILFVRQCFSVTPLIFCVTGFVSAIKKACQLTCGKKFRVALSQNLRSGFGSLQRNGCEPLL